MTKKIFDPSLVPTQPQNATNPDFTDDSIIPGGNPYLMRARMATAGGSRGAWSVVNLVDYQAELSSEVAPWATHNQSLLYNQKSYSKIIHEANKFFDSGQTKYIKHVETMGITLDENVVVNAPITGVSVWFRWMRKEAFKGWTFSGDVANGYTTTVCDRESPCSRWQVETYDPGEWQFMGNHVGTSFSIAIPLPTSTWNAFIASLGSNPNAVPEQIWFQMLVSANTTSAPNKYNYRWIGTTNQQTQFSGITAPSWCSAVGNYKVGESYVSHDDAGNILDANARGYLPWNPYYGASINNTWDTFKRQRNTFADVALFAPRRWFIQRGDM